MSSAGKVNAALAAAVIFLLLSSCAAYFAFARLGVSQGWVQHTRDVQGALGDLATTLARASRLRAEYVDSGDLALLQRQSEAVVGARNALASIHRLTSDSKGQQGNYGELLDLAEQRIAWMTQAIELKRAGVSTLEAQAAISRQITLNADTTDQLLQSMDAAEQGLLTERERREKSSFTVIEAILITSLFLALLLFLLHHQLLTDQIRERVRAESALRALSARLLTLQDQERRRFARELHDSVGQQLVAMKMGISLLDEKLPGDPTVQDCLKLLDDSISETRTISHLLHPPLLDEAGLQSAVRWFVEGFGKRSGIEVRLNIQEGVERLADPVELVLFRVLQESLTNVHRHSGAARADVSLTTEGTHVVLKIRDHGRGIPPDILQKLQHDGTGVGVGLAGMTQRIREIGGRLEFNSTSEGSEVLARIPTVSRPRPARISRPAEQEVSR